MNKNYMYKLLKIYKLLKATEITFFSVFVLLGEKSYKACSIFKKICLLKSH